MISICSRGALDLEETSAGTDNYISSELPSPQILNNFYAHAFGTANNCFNSGLDIVGVQIR
ncbi:MAG: hypothetical protein XD95_0525 [Microgenomates bacterium 39_7]|nr:MAG: hypothetical protein XD95_0525 [Microgenomates bacterium 39_7]